MSIVVSYYNEISLKTHHLVFSIFISICLYIFVLQNIFLVEMKTIYVTYRYNCTYAYINTSIWGEWTYKFQFNSMFLYLQISVDVETSFILSLTLKIDKVITICSFSSTYCRNMAYVCRCLLLYWNFFEDPSFGIVYV